jgi:hypothetical protein
MPSSQTEGGYKVASYGDRGYICLAGSSFFFLISVEDWIQGFHMLSMYSTTELCPESSIFWETGSYFVECLIFFSQTPKYQSYSRCHHTQLSLSLSLSLSVIYLSIYLHTYLPTYFYSARDWTQSLVHTRHKPNPFYKTFFWDKNLNELTSLASNLQSSCFSLLSS